jgi:hypothetical protein
MYKYFFRFVVTVLTILTADLLTNALSDYMVSYKNHYKPVIFTFIGMGLTVLVFYPLFMKLDDWVKFLSVKVIKSGSSVAGKSLGLFFTFLISIMILFYFYAKMWYHLDFLKIIFSGNLGLYI